MVTYHLYSHFSVDMRNSDISTQLFHVFIMHDGSVKCASGGISYTSCNLNLRHFPLDDQTCGIAFTTMTYTANHVVLHDSSKTVNLSWYLDSGLWTIVKTTVKKEIEVTDAIHYDVYIYQFHLRRKAKYFIFNIFLPCLILSLVALLMFYVPPESGEKISLGITVLLSFSVFQFVILDRMPETSDYIPVAGNHVIF